MQKMTEAEAREFLLNRARTGKLATVRADGRPGSSPTRRSPFNMDYTLPPQTRIGRVALTVADLERSLAYYQESIGLQVQKRVQKTAVLGVPGRELLILQEKRDARPARGVTGLYHFALLLPSRKELARTLGHLLARETPIGGYADHAVSEAIYLSDPDGHGIEIYRDRPREQWDYDNGRPAIVTKPFDFDGVLGQLGDEEPAWTGLSPETVMGHIHLHVANIPAARTFYCDVLGFDFIAAYGPQAIFVSAGGYHHHIGMNTWAGEGAPPPPPDAASLQWFEVRLPDGEALSQLEKRLRRIGLNLQQREDGFVAHDPSQNRIYVRRT